MTSENVGLAGALQALEGRKRRGPLCTMASIFLALEAAGDHAGVDALRAAVDNPAITAGDIAAAVTSFGQQLSYHTVTRHRKRGTGAGCGCPR